MSECCKNCKWLGTLWDWENYPEKKIKKPCCTALSVEEEKVAMVLYGDLEEGFCEMFAEKGSKDGKKV